MAYARLVTPKPVKQPPKRIILELSEGEADFILAVTSLIGGDPQKSPRKYSERIQAALISALGCYWHETDAYRLLDVDDNGLLCANYPTRKADR